MDTCLNLGDLDVAAEQYNLVPLYTVGYYVNPEDGCAYTISKLNTEVIGGDDGVKVVKLGPTDEVFQMLWEGAQKDEKLSNYMEVFAKAVYGQEE